MGSNERCWQWILNYTFVHTNLLQFFYWQQNYTFQGEKSGWNMSSFDGATWLISHWLNCFIFGLTTCKIKGFWKDLNNMKNRHSCEISLKFPDIKKVSLVKDYQSFWNSDRCTFNRNQNFYKKEQIIFFLRILLGKWFYFTLFSFFCLHFIFVIVRKQNLEIRTIDWSKSNFQSSNFENR